MKKLISSFLIGLILLSCGKEGKDEVQKNEPKIKNNYSVLLDAVYEKNDTCMVMLYDENDFEILKDRIKLPVKGSKIAQKIVFNIPNGMVPKNLGIAFSTNKEQNEFSLKGIVIKNGEDMLYRPEEYLKFFANNDAMVLNIPTSVHKLIHDKAYPPSFVGNNELKSILISSEKK